MSELTYIDRIKKIKSERRITNDKLSEMTGIPLGTLSKILAGISDSPKLSNMLAICRALDCSLDYIVSGTPENHHNYTLTDGEIALVEHYRRLDSHGSELVALVLDKEYERVTAQSYAPATSTIGASISAQPKFESPVKRTPEIKPSKSSFTRVAGGLGKRTISLYDLPVSAGTGVYLFDSVATDIAIPDNGKTADADYALRISGDSMEPKYHDRDVLLIQECDQIEPGELGIFVLDGEGYFKKFGGDCLISLNPFYAPIMLRDFEDIRCCGRVIGKLHKK
ncbi:MAG: helix-turn-helix domain-containing protein [Clostridia bacterium]|nr:helix-turn-helix domain-containing protein [Clostridia bacterium]